MLSNKIKKILSEVLTEKEIAVYAASMESPSSVQELAKKSGLDRVQTYQIVKDLATKGLITQEIKKHGRTILAEHPKKLVQLLGNQQRKLRREELALEELLPEILSDYNLNGFKPKVKFFEGKEGYQKICEDVLNSKEKEFFQFGNVEEIREVLESEYTQNFIQKRIGLGMYTKFLTIENQTTLTIRKDDKQDLRETRFLPAKYKLDAYKFIYGDKIAIISSKQELVGLVLESPVLTQMEKVIFNMLWEIS
jgi:sugar-specific transcriptional regulator TrmB